MNLRSWIIIALACLCLPALAYASSPDCTLSVSPTSGNAPLTVNASGACTDQDNDLTSVRLDWGDGSPAVTSQSSISASHTYSNPGKFTVSFRGFDAQGGESEKHEDVNVSTPPPNRPPTCQLNVSPTSGQAPLNVSANASCQDPDNDTITVSIAWGDGATTPGSSGTHVYPQAGDFTVTATATDSKGATESDSKQVHVTSAPPANRAPTCQLNVSPNSGQAPLAVFANANCQDPENNIVSVSINWGDGSLPTTGTSPNLAAPHTYPQPGNFNVIATATDSAGATGSASQRVNVSGGPPPPPPNTKPSCTLNVSPDGGEAPVAVTATASCTDPDNDISTIVISFGDGFYQTGPTASHVFPHGGTFTVSATAGDRAGNVSKAATHSVNTSETQKLFVGISNGQVKEFSRTGSPLRTLNTNQGGSITGMAIDSVGSLYVTNFTANTVTKFSGSGSLVGRFGSGYNCKPESIVFDKNGNAFVGQSDCSKALLKFDAYGNLFGGFAPQSEATGTDWIDLAADRCTIFYTSEGRSVLRFNVCTSQQAAPFTTDLERALAVRILEDGGAVVANHGNILRFDSSGRRIQTYDASGQDCWDALTLDRNPSSFWAADFCTSDIVRFDVDSGNQLAKFSSGTPANTVFGLAMKSAPQQTSSAGALIASPNAASIAPGQSATFSLAFDPNGSAKGKQFAFACANLPVGASCTFSPATLTVPGGGGGGDDDDDIAAATMSATLTINTAVQTGSLMKPRQSQLVYACLLPLVGIVGCGFSSRSRGTKKRRLLVFGVLMLALGLLAGAVAGCGGGADETPVALTPGTTSTTPAGTYTVGISVNSGSLSSSTSVALTVR